MKTARYNAAPLRFVLMVLGAWIGGRGVLLMGWQPPPEPGRWGPRANWFGAMTPFVSPFGGIGPGAATNPPRWAALRHGDPLMASNTGAPLRISFAATWATSTERLRTQQDERYRAAQKLLFAAYFPAKGATYRHATGAGEAAVTTGSQTHSGSRWSGSAWALARGGGHATALSPGGEIGGGQAGARILYRIGGGLSASARISRTIGGPRQTEAAVGIDWQPIASLPVHALAERRIAIDRGGRNALTLGLAGGIDAMPLGGKWRLDAYGEAGIVGARRRDLYADGAVRVARAIDLGDGRSLALGVGAWGAAQPGASRVDVGPSAVLRLPAAGHTFAVALDWRQRVTGDARPHSGVALTVGVDF